MSFWTRLRDKAVDTTGIGILYKIGGKLNDWTGGTTTNADLSDAIWHHEAGTTYSNAIQQLSGYTGDEPGAGRWTLPVVNANAFTGNDGRTLDLPGVKNALLIGAVIIGAVALREH